ncbi:hypothetical protein C1645_825518 [Glomus cerebriforme]|uniref:Ubiquitin carboxyl-terminal hydrolase n=1 Tax=Glomus cerebriforme TaxID=658196 RepID=A0A397SSH7_9GLOM|nr:hypothetical protein C1645_825518 [Glomus cerebriforme]
MSLLKWIGMGDSRKTTTNEPWSSGSEKYFGLENFGNTCYCNSILQALYFCKPFRECVINFPNGTNGLLAPPMSPINSQTLTSSLTNGIASKKDVNGIGENKANGDGSLSNGFNEDTLFSALKELFWKISSQKKRTGVMAPNGFIAKLRKENELFRSTMHQDAHEFLNYILNAVAENVMEQQRKIEELERQREQEQRCDISEKSKSSVNGTSINESEESGVSADGSSFKGSEITPSLKTTWVHKLFEGTLTNETKCLTCETITSRDDPFLDLSIDIEQNSSVTSCLRQFSASEMLVHQDKFFCDMCCGLQEAEKRMKIKKLPNILALHLKRFKYQERLQKYIKLSYRVVFPFELRLFNTCDTTKDPDRLYELYAICVHIGSGPYHGHYVTLIKSMGQWLLFDDDTVEPVDESEIQKYFGDLPATGSGYVLFYQACDLDLSSLGLPYPVWANNVASSASSADFEVSAEGAAESNSIDAQSTSTTTNGISENSNYNTTTPSINNEEPKRERQTPVREPSFSERWTILSSRKKDNNNQDKRKSHGDQDSKDNDDNNTHEKSSSHEKEKSHEKTGWFGTKSNNRSNKEKDKDKKDDKDEKKTSSNLESLFEESTSNNTQTSKKDKKAEKEERKREKKAKSENKKMEKLAAAAVSVNGIKSGTI